MDFIQHVKRECKRHGIKLLLTTETLFDDGVQTYGGYFDHLSKILAVSDISNNHNMMTTLVHEYSHMEQWIYNEPTFTHRLRGGYESTVILSQWLQGHSYKKSTIRNAVTIIRECELNCERRSLDNIKKYNLSIDIKKYTRYANAYILFYHYVLLKRQWDFTHSPLNNLNVIDQMPSNMDTLDYSKFDPFYKMLYDEVSK